MKEVIGNPESEPSVAGGYYRDPDPNVVEWINSKFMDPDGNIEATLMKAFEWAGIVKTIKEIDGLTKPLEHSGVLPPTTKGSEPPEFSVSTVPTSTFTDRRDTDLLLELQEGNDARNSLLKRVKNATVRRRLFSEEDDADLVRFIQAVRSESPEFTSAYRILRVMVGMINPEDPENTLKSVPPPETRSLAPDIYFMLLKEEREARSQDAQAAI